MLRKLIAAVLAVLINCAVFASFQTWNTAVIADVAPSGPVDMVTLPLITVRPTRAQIEMLRHHPASSQAHGAAAFGQSAHFGY